MEQRRDCWVLQLTPKEIVVLLVGCLKGYEGALLMYETNGAARDKTRGKIGKKLPYQKILKFDFRNQYNSTK